MSRTTLSRRDFIRLSCCSATGAALAAGMGRFGLVNAYAQCVPTAGYKALVCIFLFGGNDGNNMVIPFDTTGYGQYAAARTGLALPQNILLPISPGPTSQRYSAFALHPQMPGMKDLFNTGKVALVSNVGPHRSGAPAEHIAAHQSWSYFAALLNLRLASPDAWHEGSLQHRKSSPCLQRGHLGPAHDPVAIHVPVAARSLRSLFSL